MKKADVHVGMVAVKGGVLGSVVDNESRGLLQNDQRDDSNIDSKSDSDSDDNDENRLTGRRKVPPVKNSYSEQSKAEAKAKAKGGASTTKLTVPKFVYAQDQHDGDNDSNGDGEGDRQLDQESESENGHGHGHELSADKMTNEKDPYKSLRIRNKLAPAGSRSRSRSHCKDDDDGDNDSGSSNSNSDSESHFDSDSDSDKSRDAIVSESDQFSSEMEFVDCDDDHLGEVGDNESEEYVPNDALHGDDSFLTDNSEEEELEVDDGAEEDEPEWARSNQRTEISKESSETTTTSQNEVVMGDHESVAAAAAAAKPCVPSSPSRSQSSLSSDSGAQEYFGGDEDHEESLVVSENKDRSSSSVNTLCERAVASAFVVRSNDKDDALCVEQGQRKHEETSLARSIKGDAGVKIDIDMVDSAYVKEMEKVALTTESMPQISPQSMGDGTSSPVLFLKQPETELSAIDSEEVDLALTPNAAASTSGGGGEMKTYVPVRSNTCMSEMTLEEKFQKLVLKEPNHATEVREQAKERSVVCSVEVGKEALVEEDLDNLDGFFVEDPDGFFAEEDLEFSITQQVGKERKAVSMNSAEEEFLLASKSNANLTGTTSEGNDDTSVQSHWAAKHTCEDAENKTFDASIINTTGKSRVLASFPPLDDDLFLPNQPFLVDPLHIPECVTPPKENCDISPSTVSPNVNHPFTLDACAGCEAHQVKCSLLPSCIPLPPANILSPLPLGHKSAIKDHFLNVEIATEETHGIGPVSEENSQIYATGVSQDQSKSDSEFTLTSGDNETEVEDEDDSTICDMGSPSSKSILGSLIVDFVPGVALKKNGVLSPLSMDAIAVPIIDDDDDEGEIDDDSEMLVAEVVSDEESCESGMTENDLQSQASGSVQSSHCSPSAGNGSENKVAVKADPRDAKGFESFSSRGINTDSLKSNMGGVLRLVTNQIQKPRPIEKPSNDNRSRLVRKGSVKPGRWTLGALIGKGAFGSVHTCMTEAGSLLAVKVVHANRAAMKDIRQEIELLKTFCHPNVVAYCGSEVRDSNLYIFQEWVPGGSVTSMLSKFGTFSLSVSKVYLEQVLAGLLYLHSRQVLHRDIKGSNILVNDHGIVKLADFGASKQVSGIKDGMMMTMTFRGTPYFMAQEVFEERYGYKSDIWSVGCVAIQMVTGVPPWKELGIKNPVALYNHIKNTIGPPPFDISTQKGPDAAAFSSMLSRCFHKLPGDRPSARELMEDPFFSKNECSVDDDQAGASIASSFFSPRKDVSLAWEHLQSPGTPQLHCRLGHPCSSSAGCLKSPFLFSPPIPEHKVLDMDQYEKSNWPAWARTADLKSEGATNCHTPTIESTNPSVICSTLDSLAVSNDSNQAGIEKRNLFYDGEGNNSGVNNNAVRSSDHFNEVCEGTATMATLCGECLLDSMHDS